MSDAEYDASDYDWRTQPKELERRRLQKIKRKEYTEKYAEEVVAFWKIVRVDYEGNVHIGSWFREFSDYLEAYKHTCYYREALREVEREIEVLSKTRDGWLVYAESGVTSPARNVGTLCRTLERLEKIKKELMEDMK